ncbi:MAG: hypothetical protein ACPGXK_04120 [Phycisphaerae bacterium]
MLKRTVKLASGWKGLAAVAVTLIAVGCGGTVGVFNPAFVNSVSGDVFPVTPGPSAAYVLVRVVNETGEVATFDVTVEQDVLEFDDDGNVLFDQNGDPLTRIETVRRQLVTAAGAPANESGILFDCSESPVARVGLGENLLPTDAAVFIGGETVAGSPGFGVTAANLNPLSREAGNFACGDTIIFQAFQSLGVPGGVGLAAFVIDSNQSPNSFSGPNTFLNFERIQESQTREEEP